MYTETAFVLIESAKYEDLEDGCGLAPTSQIQNEFPHYTISDLRRAERAQSLFRELDVIASLVATREQFLSQEELDLHVALLNLTPARQRKLIEEFRRGKLGAPLLVISAPER